MLAESDQDPGEKKEDPPVSCSTYGEGKAKTDVGPASASRESSDLLEEEDGCNSQVLETMDSCVACVESVELQKNFEENMGTLQLVESPIVDGGPGQQGEWSPTEARMIRSQILQTQSSSDLQKLATLNDLDLLNICGTEGEEAREVSTEESSKTAPPSSSPTSTLEEPREHACASKPSTVLGDSLDQESVQCAVCFDEAVASSASMTFAKFPCCGHADESSTIKVCTSCVLLLTNPTSDGSSRVGRCPRCRSWIIVRVPPSAQHSELQISAVASAGQCKVCNQVRDHLVDQSSVCDACFLGRRYPLLYECEACHGTQRIPHPMYRYQSSPNEFGNVTWACHGGCGTFTHWRVRADQVEMIPIGDDPPEWGDSYLSTARARVALARDQLKEHESNECVIL